MGREANLRVLDLFSGIGGFALGMRWAGGFSTVAFCEIDEGCHTTLRRHFPKAKRFFDVQELSQEKLHERGVGPIDVICGGFPCQDISAAGPGGGLAGARSGLWKEFARLIGEIRPRWVLIENVPMLRHRGMGEVLRDLLALGYDAEWHCIPACAVGAPHRRDRIWICAYPRDLRVDALAHAEGQRRGQGRPAPARLEGGPRAAGGGLARGQERAGALAHPDGQRLAQRREPGAAQPALGHLGAGDQGEPGPKLATLASRLLEVRGQRSWEPCRLVDGRAVGPGLRLLGHGIPRRVERLKELGNAVVPQVAQALALALRDADRAARVAERAKAPGAGLLEGLEARQNRRGATPAPASRRARARVGSTRSKRSRPS